MEGTILKITVDYIIEMCIYRLGNGKQNTPTHKQLAEKRCRSAEEL